MNSVNKGGDATAAVAAAVGANVAGARGTGGGVREIEFIINSVTSFFLLYCSNF